MLITALSGYGAQIIYQDSSSALRIKLVKDGTEISQSFIGTDRGDNSKFNVFNQYVKTGDYIEFWAKKPDRIFITGNAVDEINDYDYAKGGKTELFEHTRFYFTEEGIKPTYNNAPKISAEDIDIYAADYTNENQFDFKTGVTVTDDHDKINDRGELIPESTSRTTNVQNNNRNV